jgi:hypothetical protein
LVPLFSSPRSEKQPQMHSRSCRDLLETKAIMSLFQMLYLQDLVVNKLHKETHLRNLVAHMALSKRLQEIQMEDNLEHYVPSRKKSESFADFQFRNPYGVPEWTNTSRSATSMYNICKEYAAMNA